MKLMWIPFKVGGSTLISPNERVSIRESVVSTPLLKIAQRANYSAPPKL